MIPPKKNTRRNLAFVGLFVVGGTLLLGGGLGARAMLGANYGDELFNLNGNPAPTPRFEWKSIDKKHWQAVSATPTEETEVTDAREGNRGLCPAGMVDVAGKYKLDAQGRESSGEVEELQSSACIDWISKDFPARCRTFDRGGWLELSQKLPTKPLHFCMDRFEYPNKLGQNPMIVVSYNEATNLCKSNGKRLCNETEWTFACEGEEAMPYPYGYERDAEACVVDRPWKPFTENGLAPRDGKKAREELDRLWQGTPSGSHAKCKSASGVYDLTGNVDEWTKTTRTSGGYASVLKGGYWGPVRARCRPATRAHNEDFVAYQQSFRCCSDVKAGAVGANAQPSGSGAAPQASASSAPSAHVPTPSTDVSVRATNPKVDPSKDDDGADDLDELDKKNGSGVGCAMSAGELSRPSNGVSSFVLMAAVCAIGLGASRARGRRYPKHD